MKRYLITLMVGLMGCLASPVMASLQWDAHRIRHVASVTEDKAEVAFTFTNTGDQPVTITTVRTSCGCTTATLDKKIYPPGETGQVTVNFTFGGRTGKQHKRITVRTSEPGDDGKIVFEDTPLYLSVTIPQPVKVRPRMVYWRPDEPRDPKHVRVTINHEGPVNITGAKVDGVAVSAELKTIEEVNQYELIITPYPIDMRPVRAPPETQAADDPIEPGQLLPDTTENQSMVSFQAEFAGEVTRTYTVMARILPESTEE